MGQTDSDTRESIEEDETQDEEEPFDEHLENIPDGSGCTEIWEHLSKERGDEDDETE